MAYCIADRKQFVDLVGSRWNLVSSARFSSQQSCLICFMPEVFGIVMAWTQVWAIGLGIFFFSVSAKNFDLESFLRPRDDGGTHAGLEHMQNVKGRLLQKHSFLSRG